MHLSESGIQSFVVRRRPFRGHESLGQVCMDAVANVRIGACKVLPLLKKALQYHESVDVPKVNRPHRTPMHISTVEKHSRWS